MQEDREYLLLTPRLGSAVVLLFSSSTSHYSRCTVKPLFGSTFHLNGLSWLQSNALLGFSFS